MTELANSPRRLVFVTGPSGAGRSSALNVLEDAGFEAIDNLPLRMVSTLLNDTTYAGPMALGIDARNRDFSTDTVLDLMAQISAQEGMTAELLYLDCSTDVLLRRFSETRRRHPMAPAARPADGIQREQALLQPFRTRADVLIDTTDLNIHQLRAEVEHWFAPGGTHELSVAVQSFSYKRGLPRSVDTVFDCRFLRNPYWVPDLRPLNGTHAAVAEHVAGDPLYAAFAQQVLDLSLLQLPACQKEGKSHFAIAFGCTGGQHRSVTLAAQHALSLADRGWQVSIRHRELDRQHHDEART